MITKDRFQERKASATGIIKKNETTEAGYDIRTQEEAPSNLEIRTESIMKKSGWDRQTAREALVRAKQQYGIRYYEYDNHDLYRLSESDLEKEGKDSSKDVREESSGSPLCRRPLASPGKKRRP